MAILESNRKVLEEIRIPLRLAHWQAKHILALTGEPGGFSFLNERLEDGEDTPALALGERSVIYGNADQLPDDPILLQSKALVVQGNFVAAYTVLSDFLLSVDPNTGQPFISDPTIHQV